MSRIDEIYKWAESKPDLVFDNGKPHIRNILTLERHFIWLLSRVSKLEEALKGIRANAYADDGLNNRWLINITEEALKENKDDEM